MKEEDSPSFTILHGTASGVVIGVVMVLMQEGGCSQTSIVSTFITLAVLAMIHLIYCILR